MSLHRIMIGILLLGKLTSSYAGEKEVKEGLSFAQTAARFNLSIQTVFSWSKRLVPQLTRNKPASKIDMLQLSEDIEKLPYPVFGFGRECKAIKKASIGEILQAMDNIKPDID